MADDESRSGHGYGSREILDWVARVHAPHDEGLQRAFGAPAKTGLPAIQVGPSEARALELLLRLVGARTVVEIGTLAGYSALRMARALPDGGHIWTIEADPRHAEVALENVRTAGLTERITVLEGPALSVLPTIEPVGPFDAVFVDADKRNYDAYGRWAAWNLRKGGLLLADNAYLFGRLLHDDPEAEAMRRFHEEARDVFETVCLPTPDGLVLGIRK